MTIYIMRSTDTGAPALVGTIGGAIPMLDYCLVTKMGWTKTVLAANQVAYQAPSGMRRFFQVDDSTAQYAHISGWETLTAFNTGTNQFPNPARNAGTFCAMDKSSTNDSTARPWKMISNGTFFHLHIYRDGGTLTPIMFGDFISYRAGDKFNALCAGTVNSGGSGNAAWAGSGAGGSMFTSANGYALLTVDRGADGISQTFYPGSQMTGSFSECSRGTVVGGNHAMGTTGPAFPDPISGGANLSPCWIGENGGVTLYQSNYVRGLIPGLWEPYHASGLSDGDTFTASSGPVNGRTFEVSRNGGGDLATLVIETSDTWGGF